MDKGALRECKVDIVNGHDKSKSLYQREREKNHGSANSDKCEPPCSASDQGCEQANHCEYLARCIHVRAAA